MNATFIIATTAGPTLGQQLLIAVGIIALGILAWVLPYRWNLFRLRRGLRGLLSEQANQMVPKILGTILILLGIAMGVYAFFDG